MVSYVNEIEQLINGKVSDVKKSASKVNQARNQDKWEGTQIEQIFKQRTYCHPKADIIVDLIRQIPSQYDNQQKVYWIFNWLVSNINYSRLKQPHFPLVRTDVDTLSLREGTCGDFSNLFVSCMLHLDIPTKYVRVKRDVYNDEQDHICAAFFDGDRWMLVDPTPSYELINGWDIRHKEIELIEPEKHWEELQNEEYQWFSIAMNKYNDAAISGILFAPWIHESIIHTTKDQTKTVFFLLTFDKNYNWKLWVTYHEQSARKRSCPIRLRSTKKGVYEWDECLDDTLEVWDENRWESKGFLLEGDLSRNSLLKTVIKEIRMVEPSILEIIYFIEDRANQK
ncbi:transglutaminase-like domain-containing protein [Heyndrickxia sp. FSL W8-0423]|uniref:transglutaminase-like domain-containing protein n=1 Tax=Heyndrickxia sp. FSL W8-0423 TaxID=2921601 RepID=UPI0030F4BA31